MHEIDRGILNLKVCTCVCVKKKYFNLENVCRDRHMGDNPCTSPCRCHAVKITPLCMYSIRAISIIRVFDLLLPITVNLDNRTHNSLG